MAVRTVEGYNCNWINDPPDHLKCIHCHLVARDPHQHQGVATECGEVICLKCIENIQGRMCPNCNEVIVPEAQGQNIFKDIKSSRQIGKLMVKCDNNGCFWTGELKLLDNHLQKCGYTILPCPNECKEGDEVKNFLKKNLQDHLENKCPRRQYRCPLCRQDGEHEAMVTRHPNSCPEAKVACKHKKAGCTAVICRSEIELHKASCEFERVPCKYEEVGCRERPLRKDLRNHEKDAQRHLEATTYQVLVLKKTQLNLLGFVAEMAGQLGMQVPNKLLPDRVQQVVEVTIPISPIRFKIEKFQELKESGKTIYSLPFYTTRDGYKIRVWVIPGGKDEGKGSHISVYAGYLKGINDFTLSERSFLGTVEITLINQLENDNHYLKSIFFIGGRQNRIIAGEQGEIVWGHALFIPHADLEYNQENNTQYLKDDKLLFHVRAE